MSLELSEWCYFNNMQLTELNGIVRYAGEDQMVCFIHRATPFDITGKNFVLEIYANKINGIIDFYSDKQFYFDKVFKCVLKADNYLNEMGFKIKDPFLYNFDLEEKL